MARPKLAGRQRRLTGHEFLRNKLSHRDVSSCRFCLWRRGLSPLHATGVINASSSGRRGWEGVRVHIGPHWAEGVGRAPPGGVWVGVWFSCRLYYPFGKGPGQHIIRCLKNKKCDDERKREKDGFRGVVESGYWGGQDLTLITLDRHECFSFFHHLQKDKQRKQRHSLKLDKKRRESSKRNYYIISPRVIIKAIIITVDAMLPHRHHLTIHASTVLI